MNEANSHVPSSQEALEADRKLVAHIVSWVHSPHLMTIEQIHEMVAKHRQKFSTSAQEADSIREECAVIADRYCEEAGGSASYKQACRHIASDIRLSKRRKARNSEIHGVENATVRDGGEDWHVECRFADGQKFAAVTVDKDHPDLAQWIANALSGEESGAPADKNISVDELVKQALNIATIGTPGQIAMQIATNAVEVTKAAFGKN